MGGGERWGELVLGTAIQMPSVLLGWCERDSAIRRAVPTIPRAVQDRTSSGRQASFDAMGMWISIDHLLKADVQNYSQRVSTHHAVS